jgi:hypothetical protein
MNKALIRAENLGRQYRDREPYLAPRDVLTRSLRFEVILTATRDQFWKHDSCSCAEEYDWSIKPEDRRGSLEEVAHTQTYRALSSSSRKSSNPLPLWRAY